METVRIYWGKQNKSGTIKVPFLRLLQKAGLISSITDGRRLAKQGAIKMQWLGDKGWGWIPVTPTPTTKRTYVFSKETYRIGKWHFVQFWPAHKGTD